MKITVCMGSSCFARGNDQNLEFIEKYIKENGVEYTEMNEEKLEKILKSTAK